MLRGGRFRFKPFPFFVVTDGALKRQARIVQAEVSARVVVMSDFVHPLADSYAGLPGWVLLVALLGDVIVTVMLCMMTLVCV